VVLGRFFLLRDGAQHVARTRNMREVDLGLDFVFDVGGGAGCPGSRPGLGMGPKTFPHQFGFVLFQGAGMRLFLRDTDFRQYVKNGLTLDLQLTGQIIDSNLHPSSVSLFLSRLVRFRCLRSHI
jgi:hypothetical protein